MTRLGVFLLVVALFGACSACSRPDSPGRELEPVPETATPNDERAAALEAKEGDTTLGQRLRQLHEEADAAETEEAKAVSGNQLFSLYESLNRENSPHLISVRQDLAARASQLLLRTSPARSQEMAQRGLELSQAPSVLRANLYLALADAEEALGNKDLAKKALVEALAINEKLFESEMESP